MNRYIYLIYFNIRKDYWASLSFTRVKVHELSYLNIFLITTQNKTNKKIQKYKS